MGTTLLLVRHGVTGANKENRFAGRSPEPLHPEGIAQSRRLGAELRHRGVGLIVAGPLPRTRQTAELIGAALGAAISVDEGLNEILIPHWDGLAKEAIRRQFGAEYPTWLAQPADFALQGCETIAQVQERAVAAAEQIFSSHQGRTVLAVSHLIVLRALILHYQNRPIREFRAVKVENGQVVALVREQEEGTTVVL